jgi:small subunit ribosomal protein S18
MSEQTTPTPEMEEGAAPIAENQPKFVPPSAPPPAPIFGDDEDGLIDEELEEELEEEEGFTAPEEYVEREGSGRVRRIGSDVRYEEIDYKNIGLLSRFLDRRGRILSRRKTRVSAKVQRKIAREIKRARQLALLPYTADQTRIVRKRK